MKPNELDQVCASFRDLQPRIWYSLYIGSMQAGFNPDQAFSLLQTYILSQTPSGIRPTDPYNESEEE